jgi:hypothetical protein
MKIERSTMDPPMRQRQFEVLHQLHCPIDLVLSFREVGTRNANARIRLACLSLPVSIVTHNLQECLTLEQGLIQVTFCQPEVGEAPPQEHS